MCEICLVVNDSLTARITGGREATIPKTDFNLLLSLKAPSTAAEKAQARNAPGLQEEVDQLLSQIKLIVKRLCRDMTFDSHTSIPQLFAEAVLRLGKAQAFGLELLQVRSRIEFRSANISQSSALVGAAIKNTPLDAQQDNGRADTPHVVQQDGSSGSTECNKSQTQLSQPQSSFTQAPRPSADLANTRQPSKAGSIEVEHAAHAPPENADAPENDSKSASTARPPPFDGIFIALGSNLGDRFKAIEDACKAIDEDEDMRIIRTSPLFETEPMYVSDQDRFLNGVCQIETSLPPLELLDRLQAIEQGMGRVKLVDKGPRNIDLDILIYHDVKMETPRLTIPHALMHERAFVLRPLQCIVPVGTCIPHNGRRMEFWLNYETSLVQQQQSLSPVVPLVPGSLTLHTSNLDRRCQVMSILNTTPDSFSDGGSNSPTDIEALTATAALHIAAGATIIDVGGQSSRPKAPDVTAEEELARVLPAIEAIRSLPEAEGVAISVDTYRAMVAEAAINAGAHIINDVSAGLLDPRMLSTIARLGCTYVMMHMRGTPATMSSGENCSYPKGLSREIREELAARLQAAEDAGIRRWRIIIDPGIGFAKTQAQNLDLLSPRSRAMLTQVPLRDIPVLVGASRKGFIGAVTGVKEAKHRQWGTAAAVTAAVMQGADIVRVHDVQEMAQVVKMAEAIRAHSTQRARRF